jgi:hypothetical protein
MKHKHERNHVLLIEQISWGTTMMNPLVQLAGQTDPRTIVSQGRSDAEELFCASILVVRQPNSEMATVVSGVFGMVVVLCPNLSKALQNAIMADVSMIIELTVVSHSVTFLLCVPFRKFRSTDR